MIFQKKGISPLIATVLIIGFTVALAAVIMVWGQGFIKGIQQSTEANKEVQLTCAEISSVISVSDACRASDNSSIKLTIKNDGNKDLTAITARAYESSNKIASAPVGTLAALGVNTFTVLATSLTGVSVANLKQVEIIPSVTIAGKQVACAQSTAQFPIGALPETVLDVCA